MRDKIEILGELRTMLRDIYTAKAAGETHVRLARAHGYVDGYMRAVLETGVATRDELVEIVAAARERASGPAMRRRETVSDVPPAAEGSASDESAEKRGETAAA